MFHVPCSMFMDLQQKLESIKKRFEQKMGEVENSEVLESLRVEFLGRKSELVEFLKGIKDLAEEEKKKFGPVANQLRQEIEILIEEKKKILKDYALNQLLEKDIIDITAPSKKVIHGHLHPLTLMRRKIENIFESMGFEIVEGPEVETEYYNFDALNVPADHPAREMQDTFWLQDNRKVSTDNKKLITNNSHESSVMSHKLLMRTQTSSVQIRYAEKNDPPIRIISPGRAFRFEATDQTHDIQFHQVEGLMIDKNITLANLKGVLEILFKKIFGKEVEVRFRPSYFPFVEPGVEFDMKFRGKWMEVGGAGMVHPKVLDVMGIDKSKWRGFAFGMGLERLAMIKYGIDDVRLFSSGDLRFLKQF